MRSLDVVEPCERTGTLSRRVPDFFVVGHPKCGTTALYEMLRSHPQIFMPSVKEPTFLATDHRFGSRTQTPFPEWMPATLEAYLDLFGPAKPGQVVGEASTQYLTSRDAASSIAGLNSAARVITIFREPASFLRSLHLHMLRTRFETVRDLCSALDLEIGRRRGEFVPRQCYWQGELLYSERTHYVEQLLRYRAVLPSDQILTLIYDDFCLDNAGTVRRVLEFLGVDPAFPIQMVEANRSVAIRPAADRMLRRMLTAQDPASRAVKHLVKTVIPQSARRAAISAFRQRVVYAPPPPPDEALMAELRRRFKPEVVRFSELLERDLVALWGYDHV